MLFNRTILHHPLRSLILNRRPPPRHYIFLLHVVHDNFLWGSLIIGFCYSFPFAYCPNLFHSSLTPFLTFLTSSPCYSCSLPQPLMSFSLLVFLSLQPLTASTASLCNAAGTLRPSLLAFSSLSHNLLAAHSCRLSPLFIDRGMGGPEEGLPMGSKRRLSNISIKDI